MSRILSINESLLDKVEAGEVEDDEHIDGVEVSMSVNVKVSVQDEEQDHEQAGEYVPGKVSMVLERAVSSGVVLSYDLSNEPDRSAYGDESGCQMSVNFVMDNDASLRDFCDLLVRMFLPSRFIDTGISRHLVRIVPNGKQYVSISNLTDPKDKKRKKLSILSDESFFDMFVLYFPDVSKDEILREFVRSYALWQKDGALISVIYIFVMNGPNKANVIVDGRVAIDEWFNEIDSFDGRIAIVKKSGLVNFYDIERHVLLSNIWFNNARPFSEGFAVVIVGSGPNDASYKFMDMDGNYALDGKSFAYATGFNEGLSMVLDKNMRCYFIDTEGNFITKDGYSGCHRFSEGYAVVVRDDQMANYIDKKGKLLSDEWFFGCCDFKCGFGLVLRSSSEFNYIDRNGNIISDVWFDSGRDFCEGFGIVGNVGQGFNYIKPDGNLLFPDKWFNICHDFKNGYCSAMSDKSPDYKFYDKNGNEVSDMTFDKCRDFCGGFAAVHIDFPLFRGFSSGWNYIGENGKILYECGLFDMCYDFRNGFGLVKLDGKFNYIDSAGKLVSSKWLDNYMEMEPSEDMLVRTGFGCGGFVDSVGNFIAVI